MKGTEVSLDVALDFLNGKAPILNETGEYAVYGSNGPLGWSQEFNHEAGIILGRVGAYCGSVAICEERFWASDNTIVVKPKVPQSLRYWYYRLLTVSLRGFAGGAAQPLITHSILRGVKAKIFADPNVQQHIADVLWAYDELIENNRRRMELLEEAARHLYREWFVRLRFPGREHTRIINGVPEGWERKTLAQLCESVDYGYTASAEHEEVGPKLLRITDIVPAFIDWSSVPYCKIEDDRLSKFRLSEGDIVIARTGATVGYAKRLHKRHPEAVFASYLVRLRLKSETDNLMVGIFVESDDYKKYVQSRIGGAAQPNANAKVLASAEILVPPTVLQRAFRDFVEPLVDQLELLQIQNEKLRAARDLLLPRLMSGEVLV
jgi:type I restriction enzyme, S subunit